MLNNRFARKFSSIAASAVLFAGVGGPTARPQISKPPAAVLPEGHRLWLASDYNAVVDVWECPERGLCARLHHLDPDNLPTRKLLADHLLHKPVEQVTADDVNRLCGRESTLIFTHIPKSAFDSTLRLPPKNIDIGIKVSFKGDSLEARAFLPLFGHGFTPFGKSLKLSALPAVVPACIAPKH